MWWRVFAVDEILLVIKINIIYMKNTWTTAELDSAIFLLKRIVEALSCKTIKDVLEHLSEICQETAFLYNTEIDYDPGSLHGMVTFHRPTFGLKGLHYQRILFEETMLCYGIQDNIFELRPSFAGPTAEQKYIYDHETVQLDHLRRCKTGLEGVIGKLELLETKKRNEIWYDALQLYIAGLTVDTYEQFEQKMNDAINKILALNLTGNPYKELKDFNFGFSVEHQLFDMAIGDFWMQYSQDMLHIRDQNVEIFERSADITEQMKVDAMSIIQRMVKQCKPYAQMSIEELLSNQEKSKNYE